jgi:riboflavin kinase/FMN adenylyltransferase
MIVSRDRRSLERIESSVTTVGTFDGVHIGHRTIIDYAVRRARQGGLVSTVVSFDPHPRAVVTGADVPLLTTVPERVRLMEDLGVDRFVVLRFDNEFSHLGPEAFVREILVEEIGLAEMVVGHDHGFGRGRSGDSEVLMRLSSELGFLVHSVSPKRIAGLTVSSSSIRQLLASDGLVADAAVSLGRFYSIEGRVVSGDGRGRTIGFPTANIALGDPRKVVPAGGVYAVRVQTGSSEVAVGGMLNVGTRPTFGGGAVRVEVHLLNWTGDLYGAELRVEFVERIRSERKFDSVEALAQQLRADHERCTMALKTVL